MASAACFYAENDQVGQGAIGAAILLRKQQAEYTGVGQRLPQSVGHRPRVRVAELTDQARRALGEKKRMKHRRQISLVLIGQQFHDLATITVRKPACRGHAGR